MLINICIYLLSIYLLQYCSSGKAMADDGEADADAPEIDESQANTKTDREQGNALNSLTDRARILT